MSSPQRFHNTREECGVFLINSRQEILLIHQTNTNWRKWILPSLIRRPPTRLEEQASQALVQLTNIESNPNDLIYLGISRHASRREIFHGFLYRLTTPEQFSCRIQIDDPEEISPAYVAIDAYRWLPPDRAINYLPKHQADQLPLLVDYLVREQANQLITTQPQTK